MALASYIRTQPIVHRPRLLDVMWAERYYPFSLETAHILEHRIGTGGRPREHDHPVYHVVLFTAGKNWFLLDGRETASQPGTLVLTDPGRPHDFGPLEPGYTHYHEVTFAFEHETGPLTIPFYQLLARYAGIDLGPIEFPQVLRPKPLAVLDSLYRELLRQIDRAGTAYWFEVYRTVLNILAFAVRELYLPAGREAGVDESPLAEIKAFIDRYYARAIHLEDLAEKAHYSTAHLCRAFKKEYGLSPIAYQQTLRIAAAQNLIRSTNLQCKEIAHRLGFADGYAFSKAFKKAVGVSPERFRS